MGNGEKVISLAVAFFILISRSPRQEDAEFARSIDALSETSDLDTRQDEGDVTSDVVLVVSDSLTTADDEEEEAPLLNILL